MTCSTAKLVLPHNLSGLPHPADQRHVLHRPRVDKIAFRVRNTDGANPLGPATPNPAASSSASRCRVLASQVVLDSALVEFSRTESRSTTSPWRAGRGPHRRGQAGGQPPGIADAAEQPAPSQSYEGSLGLRVLDDTAQH